MNLQKKLLLHLCLSILVALLILVFIVMRMLQMQATMNEISETLLRVEQYNSSLVSYQQALGNFGRNPTNSNELTVVNKYEDILEKSAVLQHIPFAHEIGDDRIILLQQKLNNIEEYMDIIVSDKDNKTIEAMQLSSKLLGVINDVYLLRITLEKNYEQLINVQNKQILSTSITSGILLLLASSIIFTITTQRIITPIQELNKYSQLIAAGDLTLKEIEITTNDEVGQLAHSFNIMKKNLNEMFEKLVLHSKELEEKNARINDSIQYAKRIQQAIMPSERILQSNMENMFLLWMPRDNVGGDFVWEYKTEKGLYLAVGDCTGHGVPGALMTTLSISALNNILDQDKHQAPAEVLMKLNKFIKKYLGQDGKFGNTDDGLDIGLCYIENNKIIYSGAKLSLYVKTTSTFYTIVGEKKSVGYRRTPSNYDYVNHDIEVNEKTMFYITTDGYFDQNGGEKNFPFGKKQFSQVIEEVYDLPVLEQKERFQLTLQHFMGNKIQRDDITVIGFQLGGTTN